MSILPNGTKLIVTTGFRNFVKTKWPDAVENLLTNSYLVEISDYDTERNTYTIAMSNDRVVKYVPEILAYSMAGEYDALLYRWDN